MEHNGKRTEGTAKGERAPRCGRPSDADGLRKSADGSAACVRRHVHGAVGFLGPSVESVGPVGGPAAAVPDGGSTLDAAPVSILGQCGGPGGLLDGLRGPDGRHGMAAGGHASSRVDASAGLVEHPGGPLGGVAGLGGVGGGLGGVSVADSGGVAAGLGGSGDPGDRGRGLGGGVGVLGGPRGAAILKAVAACLTGKAASPGRARRRGGRGVRGGPQTAPVMPDSVPSGARPIEHSGVAAGNPARRGEVLGGQEYQATKRQDDRRGGQKSGGKICTPNTAKVLANKHGVASDSNAPTAGMLDKTASAPKAGSLPEGRCTQSEPPARFGLCGSAHGDGQAVVRWAVWPPPADLPAAGTSAPEKKPNNGNDVDRVISYAFPGGASEKQQAAVINAVANAVRLGASYPLLAHAAVDPAAQRQPPWICLEKRGKEVAGLLTEARRVWPPDNPHGFKGNTFLDLLKHMPEGWRPKPVTRRDGEHEVTFLDRQHKTEELADLAERIDAWREQALNWPDNGVAAPDGVARQRYRCQVGPSAGFLSQSGASIVPLGGLRGPVDGRTRSMPYGGSILSGAFVRRIEHPGAHGGVSGGLPGPAGGLAGGHGSSRMSTALVGQSGGAVGPLDGLRGPGGGPVAAVSQGDSTLAGGSAAILNGPGRSDGLPVRLDGQPENPRGAAVLQAVTVYLRRNARRQGQKRGRHSTGIARPKGESVSVHARLRCRA
jgi:hypothetical protein